MNTLKRRSSSLLARSGSNSNISKGAPSSMMIRKAARELEAMRAAEEAQRRGDGASAAAGAAVRFPSACHRLLTEQVGGNTRCVDCGSPNPDWACVSYGALVCLQCSGRHRGYGVATSVVRSIHMDAWTADQVVSMLEGGNEQLKNFFERHRLASPSSSGGCVCGGDDSMTSNRYRTKAAQFYRVNLARHVGMVAASGPYKGRDHFRSPSSQQQKQQPRSELSRELPSSSLSAPSSLSEQQQQVALPRKAASPSSLPSSTIGDGQRMPRRQRQVAVSATS